MLNGFRKLVLSENQTKLAVFFVDYLAIPILIFLAILAVYGESGVDLFSFSFILFACLIVLIVTILKHQMEYILEDEVDVEKYERYVTTYYNGNARWGFFKEKQAMYLFSQAKILFHRGKFKETITLLDSISYEHFGKSYRENMRMTSHYLRFRSQLYLSHAPDLQEFQKNLLVRGIPASYQLFTKGEAIYDLDYQGKSNDFFEAYQPVNALDKLYAIYFQALNAQIKGDNEWAIVLFKQVSQSSPAFFIVQEAKKWLENNTPNIDKI